MIRVDPNVLAVLLPLGMVCYFVPSLITRRGLAVVGEDAFAVGDNAPRGIRVSLGAARNRSELSQALQVLSDAMKTPATVQII